MEQYPNIYAVCELLDLVCLTDLMAEDGDESKAYPCYAIGARPELEAGLRGCTVTPYFDSEAKLEAFCGLHIEKFEAMYSAETLWYVDDEGKEIGRPK